MPVSPPPVVRPGDPTIQKSGQARGSARFNFDDGYFVERNIRTATEAEFAPKVTAMIPEIEAQRRARDAETVNESDPDDTGNGDASTLDTMVSKLRHAYRQPAPEDCYRNMKQIDDYRSGKGWTWGDVHDAIFAVPEYQFTEEEWTNISDRYAYLSPAPKVAVMIDYNALLVGDTWGEEFR